MIAISERRLTDTVGGPRLPLPQYSQTGSHLVIQRRRPLVLLKGIAAINDYLGSGVKIALQGGEVQQLPRDVRGGFGSKKRDRGATSSGRPGRPMGICARDNFVLGRGRGFDPARGKGRLQ